MKVIINEEQSKRLFINELHVDGFDWNTVVNLLEKGYLVHGTNEDFVSFDPNKIKGGNRAEFGYGMYFTDAAYKALEYGQEIYFTKMDIYNFLSLDEIYDESLFDEYLTNKRDLEMVQNALGNVSNIREYEYYTKQEEELKEKFDLDVYEETILDYFLRAMNEYPSWTLENVFKYVRGNLSSMLEKYISTLFLKLGYDGFVCGNQYVIFNFNLLNQNLLKEELTENINKTTPLNEGVDNVIRLYHGTTFDALCDIMDSGEINALNGRQHGETRGINWFNTKLSNNFNQGVIFSITATQEEFNQGKFKFMNRSDVTSNGEFSKIIPLDGRDFRIESFGGIRAQYDFDVLENVLEMKNNDVFETVHFLDNMFEKQYPQYVPLMTPDNPIFIQLMTQIGKDNLLKDEGII